MFLLYLHLLRFDFRRCVFPLQGEFMLANTLHGKNYIVFGSLIPPCELWCNVFIRPSSLSFLFSDQTTMFNLQGLPLALDDCYVVSLQDNTTSTSAASQRRRTFIALRGEHKFFHKARDSSSLLFSCSNQLNTRAFESPDREIDGY